MSENREIFKMENVEIDEKKKIVVVLSEDKSLEDICKEMIERERIDEHNYGKTFVIILNGTINGKYSYWLREGWSLKYGNRTYTTHDILYSKITHDEN